VRDRVFFVSGDFSLREMILHLFPILVLVRTPATFGAQLDVSTEEEPTEEPLLTTGPADSPVQIPPLRTVRPSSGYETHEISHTQSNTIASTPSEDPHQRPEIRVTETPEAAEAPLFTTEPAISPVQIPALRTVRPSPGYETQAIMNILRGTLESTPSRDPLRRLDTLMEMVVNIHSVLDLAVPSSLVIPEDEQIEDMFDRWYLPSDSLSGACQRDEVVRNILQQYAIDVSGDHLRLEDDDDTLDPTRNYNSIVTFIRSYITSSLEEFVGGGPFL
jgi:hypothetical protein